MLIQTKNLGLVLITGLSLGIMTFDQASIGYLLPFIQPELALSNSQIGLLASVYWVPFAIFSYLTGIFASSRGAYKSFIIVVLILFGAALLLHLIMQSAETLMISRAIMGALAGSLLTLVQSILSLNSTPERVGLNMGLVNGFGGNMFGMVIAPLVLIQIALMFGWRAGYAVMTVPAIICAGLVYAFIADPLNQNSDLNRKSDKPSLTILQGVKEAFKDRNIRICAILCSLFVGYVSLALTFMPIFLVNERNFTPQSMSLLIVMLGISAIVFSVLLPALSNKYGRKPIMIASAASSVIVPLTAVYFTGPMPITLILLFIGWSYAGTGAFIMGIIPAESVRADVISVGLGIIIALGVLVGGLAAPTLAGIAADAYGLKAPLLIQAACVLAAAIFSLGLRETAPNLASQAKTAGLSN